MPTDRCLVIGDINIDFAIHSSRYPLEGGEAHADQADFRLGGSGCITAICLELLGMPTSLAGNLGEDVFSQFIQQHLMNSHLDASLVSFLKGEQTGFFMILVTPGGQRTMFGNRGANAIALNKERLISRIGEFKHLHISGYSLLTNDQYDVITQVIVEAKAKGLTVSLDPGVCTSEKATEKIFDLLKHMDYFLPSMDELNTLVSNNSLEGKIQILKDYGCKAIVLKKGKDGAQYFGNDDSPSVPAENEPGKRIIDTTGAGDCFNAGFLFGILNGYTPQEALRMANGAAYRMITSQHGIIELIQSPDL